MLIGMGCAGDGASAPSPTARQASASTTTISPSPTTSRRDTAGVPVVSGYDSLVSYLDGAGFLVQVIGDVEEFYFSVIAKALEVNGELVRAFEFPDAETAATEAQRISPDGTSVELHTESGLSMTSISWIAPPHFYRNGKLIVLYVGWDTRMTEVMEMAVGPQFSVGKSAAQ